MESQQKQFLDLLIGFLLTAIHWTQGKCFCHILLFRIYKCKGQYRDFDKYLAILTNKPANLVNTQYCVVKSEHLWMPYPRVKAQMKAMYYSLPQKKGNFSKVAFLLEKIVDQWSFLKFLVMFMTLGY